MKRIMRLMILLLASLLLLTSCKDAIPEMPTKNLWNLL